ncbi:MAG: ferredoxin [Candidatus Omnitrophica bacterium]|nr:ferredoxin [Candidatus Omnitrophota bacterium]
MADFRVDDSLCTGCGLCAASCPELFEVGDDNKAHVKPQGTCDKDPDEIVSECPVNAITAE